MGKKERAKYYRIDLLKEENRDKFNDIKKRYNFRNADVAITYLFESEEKRMELEETIKTLQNTLLKLCCEKIDNIILKKS